MIIVYYAIGAAVAAWLTADNRHLDWKISLFVLPLMFMAHFGYNMVRVRKGGKRSELRSHTRQCLACRGEIGLAPQTFPGSLLLGKA